MKALTLLTLLVSIALVGCGSVDKSSDTQTLATPPAKSPVPGGMPANIPPQAQKAMGGK